MLPAGEKKFESEFDIVSAFYLGSTSREWWRGARSTHLRCTGQWKYVNELLGGDGDLQITKIIVFEMQMARCNKIGRRTGFNQNYSRDLG